MYLKEIEIQGFKSFADKTKVVFDKGVTAVVGLMDLENQISRRACAGPWGNPVSRVYVGERCPMSSLQGQNRENR